MLLAIDVGNTCTLLGVFEQDQLKAHWRVQTNPDRTVDEYAVLCEQLFALKGLSKGDIDAGILACVVPPLQDVLVATMADHLELKPVVVGPGIRTGMPILMDNPKEVGADRIVNAVAAYEKVKSACIVVDFGTATTFDVVSGAGEYLGGAISPGIRVSAEALYRAAAKLPRVPVMRPRNVVGRSTEESIQSGIVYGYVGLVDGMVERMVRTLSLTECAVIATGGQARLIAGVSSYIREVDDFLTLTGLRILYGRNRR
jgi:type III pantothenate kinase